MKSRRIRQPRSPVYARSWLPLYVSRFAHRVESGGVKLSVLAIAEPRSVVGINPLEGSIQNQGVEVDAVLDTGIPFSLGGGFQIGAVFGFRAAHVVKWLVKAGDHLRGPLGMGGVH